MLFSEIYDISDPIAEEWFDPLLDHDTELFIDPFLVFKLKHPLFKHAHDKLIKFFNEAFRVAAESRGNIKHTAYKKLINMLIFPEVSELCLGYTERSTAGSGSSFSFAKIIARTILQSIAIGVKNIEHFEELWILGEGIGCDRISDMTANILKPELIEYTQKICNKLELKQLTSIKLPKAYFDFEFLRWENRDVNLPLNKYTREGILLVPKKFLRELPTINYEDFWDYAWDNRNEQLRTDFNYEVKSKVNKKDIIKIAKQKRFWVNEYIKELEEVSAQPYNLEVDPDIRYKWYLITQEFVANNPVTLTVAKDERELLGIVKMIIEQFRIYIEDNSGYLLLWNEQKNKPRMEKSSQLLFLGIAKHYCKANNIDISKEVDLGRGPVDFKFSNGYTNRILIETKHASSPKLFHGLEDQLPQYMKSEEVKRGYYVVLIHKDEDIKKINKLRDILEKVKKKTGYELEVFTVDATLDKPSASMI